MWYALRGGSGLLYDALHTVFDKDFPPTALHHFIASMPGLLRETRRGRPPLVVTTNYDDLMECALNARNEEYDVVVYMAEGEYKGRFCHVVPPGDPTPIEKPEAYLDVDPDRRMVILKMHGFVSRRDAFYDSYVITEDHYIDYLVGSTNLNQLLPARLMARLLNSNLLFLGYSLRDWNFRAILHRLQLGQLHVNDWWAVLMDPSSVERSSWERRNVKLLSMSLEDYVPALQAQVIARLRGDRERAS